MSFIINQNFDLKSPQFNFARDYFANLEALKTYCGGDWTKANYSSFPDNFITNVGGTLYQYSATNDVDSNTGKWRKILFGNYITKSSIGLGNVDNTSDRAKPISTATQNALDTKADKNKSISTLTIGAYENSVNIDGTLGNGGLISTLSIPLATYESSTDNNQRAGLVTGAERKKLNGIAANANNYSLPAAADSKLGGIALGYSETAKNYAVKLDNNNKAYVTVPWVNTDTKYSLPVATKDVLGGIKIGFTQNDLEHNYPVVLSTTSQAYVKVPLATYNILNDTGQKDGLITGAERRAIHLLSLSGLSLANDGGFELSLGGVIGDNNGTVTIPFVTTGMDDVSYGLMRGSDKNKLDGIEKGANKTIVDTALNINSTNCVQNKAVAAAINSTNNNVSTISKNLSTLKTTVDSITSITETEINNLFK